jgi:hypothetical protein
VAVLPAVTITEVELFELVNGLVTNEAAVPMGKPETDSEMFPEKPFSGVSDNVNTVASVGFKGGAVEAASEKSGGAMTTKVALTQVVWPPLTPLIANG